MGSKVLLLFAVLCLLGSCWGKEETTRDLTRHEDIPIEPIGVPSDSDLNQDATFWRLWKSWKWGSITEKKMLDPQRVATKRDGSSTARRQLQDLDSRRSPSTRVPSAANLYSDSSTSISTRPRVPVRMEIITVLFESMVNSIVKSWITLERRVTEEEEDLNKAFSEVTITKKKKTGLSVKSSKVKQSASKLNLGDAEKIDPIQQVWWSSPDEKAIIKFINGNTYEGNISMKCMHGEGRFQWKNGTVYFGEFYYNEIRGKGRICWKDDTWYDGEFVGNIRHGKGIYVNSRKQSCYCGEWNNGIKHGKGVIYYDGTFKNNYDGEWVQNVRHGYGAREYCANSGYEGNWDRYVRDGKGLMIWANHDYYEGDWAKGLMSGRGTYIWNTQCNNTLALPVISVYRGNFEKGNRSGQGTLSLGLNWGAHYEGCFKDNKKHGIGKVVTNNGLIIQNDNLYRYDILQAEPESGEMEQNFEENGLLEPLFFNICDEDVGLSYHVEKAYENLDREAEIQASIINDYIENNRYMEIDVSPKEMILKEVIFIDSQYNQETLDFEKRALRNVVRDYQKHLIKIFYKYCEICIDEPVSFTPHLIRLFLWKFYWDCNLNAKGLTLVEIDNMLYSNPAWCCKSPHNPFQKIFYWQFIHSIIAIASKLYASKALPGPKPDTIVATAFRKFMDEDVLPGCIQPRCGHFIAGGCASYIPLKPLYGLYLSLGQPHTVRQFICAVHRPYFETDSPKGLVDLPEPDLGRNVYIFGDRISFVMDNIVPLKTCADIGENPQLREKNLLLFNFSILSTATLIKIFGNIFPQLLCKEKIMSLDIEMTFFEFFEAYVACAEESIRLKEEELNWRVMFPQAD